MNENKTKIWPCSLEHYDRYRLRGTSGVIVAVGSLVDMARMRNPVIVKGNAVCGPVEGSIEFFANATK